MPNNFTTRTASLRATTASVHKLDTKEVLINGENIDSKYASLNASNSFTGNNSFQTGIKILPLGTTTLSGQDAYGLSISPPSADGTSGGLQLWGVQFSQGDEWSQAALKINHPQLALYGTSAMPSTISFDNANVVEFKTMPDNGGAVGVTYDFQSWQWTDDSQSVKTNTAPVQILKNNAISLNEKSVLNMGESDARYYTKTLSDDRFAQLETDNTFDGNITVNGTIASNSIKKGGTSEDNDVLNRSESDARYARLAAENTFSETNTFEEEVQLENGATANNNINLRSGDLLIHENGNLTFFDDGVVTTSEDITKSNISYQKVQTPQVDANNVLVSDGGCITFQDGIDGTVIERDGSSGYRYNREIPITFENGVCYDIGTITDETNLSNVTFTSENLIQTCEVWFQTPATPPTTHQWPANTYWIDSATGAAPTLIANKNYRIVFRREPNKIIASIAYLY